MTKGQLQVQAVTDTIALGVMPHPSDFGYVEGSFCAPGWYLRYNRALKAWRKEHGLEDGRDYVQFMLRTRSAKQERNQGG